MTTQLSEKEKALIRQAAERAGYKEVSVWVRKELLDRAHSILSQVVENKA